MYVHKDSQRNLGFLHKITVNILIDINLRDGTLKYNVPSYRSAIETAYCYLYYSYRAKFNKEFRKFAKTLPQLRHTLLILLVPHMQVHTLICCLHITGIATKHLALLIKCKYYCAKHRVLYSIKVYLISLGNII